MKHLFLLKTFLIACISMLIGGGNAVAQTTIVTDVLDYTISGAKGTSYTPFTDKSLTSAAIYAGNAAAGYSAIQLRSSNSNSGIVTTTSGGNVRKITVEWNSNTSSERTLDIYGKSTAYSAATDLYSNSDKGEKLGSIKCGTSTELTIEGDYAYIGLRSSSSAMYINSITIEWEVAAAGAPAKPTIEPKSGMFDGSQQVKITSENGTTIWYTTDESEPVANEGTSTKYTVPFEIDETTTVKAIAISSEGIASATTTATYTKIEWLSGLSTLVTKIKDDNSSTAKEYYVNLSGAVVTGISGSNAYLEEGETGILFYKYGHSLEVGKKYSGKATVTAEMYKGCPQITAFDCATVEENVALPLTAVTIDVLMDNFDTYLSRRVKIEDAIVTKGFDGTKKATIVQNATQLNLFANAETYIMPLDHQVDVIGWPNVEDLAKELKVWSQDDITDDGEGKLFSFLEGSFSVRIGSSFSKPELKNTYDDKAVTYESSNPEVATVNETTGEVTIIDEGVTTITAKLASVNKESSYTLTVIGKIEGEYYLVKDKIELVPGARYLIVCNTKEVAMGAVPSGKTYREGIKVNSFTDSKKVISTKPEGAREVVLVKSGDNWGFYLEDDECFLALTSASNAIHSSSRFDAKCSVSIELDDDGNTDISFITNARYLRYNYSNPRFACYTSGQAEIQLYKLYTTSNQGSFSISEAANGYSTLYTEDAFVMPEGVDGAVVTGAEGSTLTIDYKYKAGTIVPAKTPLLLKGVAGDHVYGTLTYHETAPTGNMLHGADAVDADGKTFVEGDNVYYVLSKKDGKMGFYWAAADGAPVAYQAGKAFLAVPKMSGAKLFSSLVFDDANTTGIEAVETVKPVDGAVYTLMGVRVGNDLNSLPKGLYIRNGKKVLVK